MRRCFILQRAKLLNMDSYITQSLIPNVSNEDIELGGIDDINKEHREVQLVHVLSKIFLFMQGEI